MATSFPSSGGFILVDFYADWCEPCKWALPIIEEVIKHFNGEIQLEKINIDHFPDIAKEYIVMSVPTFILFHDKKEIWRIRGFDIAPVMIRKIEQAIKEFRNSDL